ncbi:MAG: TetR/AcrR family transcriptional regulator [Alphaproteobacteria bacterium]
MARPKAFNPEEALERATALFWRKGYAGASVADLVEALGVNRGSLYGAFKDKRALFLAAIERYDECEIGATVRHLRNTEGPGRDRIQSLFDGFIRNIEERGDRRGCLVCNTAVEVGGTDSAIEHHVKAVHERLAAAFSVALAADPGFPSEPERRDRRAHFLTATLMGFHVMARAGAAPETLRGVVRIAMRGLA